MFENSLLFVALNARSCDLRLSGASLIGVQNAEVALSQRLVRRRLTVAISIAFVLQQTLVIREIARAQSAPIATQRPAVEPSPPSSAQTAAPSASEPTSGSASKLGVKWQNTVRYSNSIRTQLAKPLLVASPNLDDGDRNFSTGFVSNRLDLFSELDASNTHFGARVSGEGWFDTVYRGTNANTSPATVNHINPAYNIFPYATRRLSGFHGKLLDAFIFGNAQLPHGMHVTLRAGRHALTWGETLFFGANGIANAMTPIDLTKLLQQPNSQFKEFILPVNQISGELQLNPHLTLGAFYQLEWEKDLFPPVGSYFGSSDAYDAGAQRLVIGGPLFPNGPLTSLYAGSERYPRNNKTKGLEVRWRPGDSGFDLGFYALEYSEHESATEVFQFGTAAGQLPGQIGQFYPTYPQGIQTYGASVSKTLSGINFTAEGSWRQNAPLNANSVVCGALPGLPPGVSLSCGNNSTLAPYPLGDTLHANVSMLWSLPVLRFAKESNIAAEVAYNHVLKVTQNPALLNPNGTSDGAAVQAVFTPTYRQVKPGIDVSVPIGLQIGLTGKPNAVEAGNLPAGGVGNFSIAFDALIHEKYSVDLGFTSFLGPAGTFLDSANYFSFQQYYRDRNFISFSVSRSF